MKRFAIFILIIATSLSALTGCEYYKEKPQLDGFQVPNVDSSTVSYQIVKSAVFARKCIACHGNSGGVSLENYSGTIQNLRKVEDAIFSNSMPKAPNLPLSNQEKSLIRTWIQAGAPEYAQGEHPTPAPVLEPRFSSIRKLVFEQRCITCHATGGTAEKVPLVDYQALLTSPRDLVLPKNADESGLVIAIERTDDRRMPPPEVGNALTNDELKTIRKWIEDGAENN